MFGLTATWQIRLGEYLIVIAVVCGMFYYTYNKGYEASDQKWTVLQATANTAAQSKYNLVAQQLEVAKADRVIQTQYITKTVTKLVDRPVYQNVCLDADGLAVINKALSGAKDDSAK